MKKYRKVSFVIFHRRFMSSNFAAGTLKLMRTGQNLWHESPLKNDKVHFSVFFHWQIFLYIKAKLMVSKSLYSTRRYFFIWHIWQLQIKKRNLFFFQLCPSAKLVTSFCFVIFKLNNWYIEKRMKSITKNRCVYTCILSLFQPLNGKE